MMASVNQAAGTAPNHGHNDPLTSSTAAADPTPTLTGTPSPSPGYLTDTTPPLTDTASLQGGSNPTGTITFTLIGPFGSTVDVETVPVNGNGFYTTPTGYTLPATGQVTGTYQWNISYSGDGINTAVSDNNDPAEQVTLNPATPSLGTISGGPADIAPRYGGAFSALSETAMIGGGFNPTGTITFTLLDPNLNQVFSSTVAVNGNGDYSSGGYTATLTGVYQWNISYSGDANNNAASAFDQENVNQLTLTTTPGGPVTLGSGAKLTDSATLADGTNPTGYINFTLFLLDVGNVYIDSVPVTGNGTYSTDQGNNPGGYLPTLAGTYQWQVQYSGDPLNVGVGDFSEQETVNPASPATPNLTTTPNTVTLGDGNPLTDTATVSGGFNPGGTITFDLYGPSSAAPTSTLLYSDTVNVSGDGQYSAPGIVPTAAGQFQWQVSYSGDANNNPVGETIELVNVTAPAGVATTLSLTPSVNPSSPGQVITETATITAADGSTPLGLIGFTVNGSFAGFAPLDGVPGNDQAVFTDALLPSGTNTIQAHFYAVSPYATSDASTTQTVTGNAQLVVYAGLAFADTVTIHNADGSVDTTYTGTEHFTSSDPAAVLPPDYTYQLSDQGVHTFQVTLNSLGYQTITSTDTVNPSQTSSATVFVIPHVADHLGFVAQPSNTVAGQTITPAPQLAALDSLGNPVPTDNSTITLSVSGTTADGLPLPAGALRGTTSASTANGVSTFGNLAIDFAGFLYLLHATDGNLTPTTSAPFTITPGPTSQLLVVTPSSVTAGSPFDVSIVAADQFFNQTPDYTGTIQITSSDPLAQLPANYTFVLSDEGEHTFSGGAVLQTGGLQTISATDTVTPSITGTSNITVTPGAATQLLVAAPSIVNPGIPFDVTVTAEDAFGNVATGYLGTLHFTSTDADPAVILPSDYTFQPSDQGSHTFSNLVLQTVGNQTTTATDIPTSAITGGASIAVVSSSDPPPPALDRSYQVTEDGQLKVSAANGLLANDSDPDGDKLQVVLRDEPQNGSLNLRSDGSFTYTPDPNFTGVDYFGYETVEQDGEVSREAIAQIFAMGKPNPKKAEITGPSVVPGNSAYSFKVTNPPGGFDPGDANTWKVVSGPAKVVEVSGDPSIPEIAAKIEFENKPAVVKLEVTVKGVVLKFDVDIVQVIPGTPTFTHNGTPGSGPSAAPRKFQVKDPSGSPPQQAATPQWDVDKLMIDALNARGGLAAGEPAVKVTSDKGNMAFTAATTVTLVAPKGHPSDIQHIQVGFIQTAHFGTGSALYQGGKKRVLDEAASSDALDWYEFTVKNGQLVEGSTDAWPWYSNAANGGNWIPASPANTTHMLHMVDTPTTFFPSQWNPLTGGSQALVSANAKIDFVLHVAALSLDERNSHWDEANRDWNTAFTWANGSGNAVVTVGAGAQADDRTWRPVSKPTLIDVNGVAGGIYTQAPYLTWVPQ